MADPGLIMMTKEAWPEVPVHLSVQAIDDALANRGYTDGFYQRHHTHEQQNYLDGYSKSHQQQFCGEIRNYDKATGLAEIDVKNKFSVGDKLEVILPGGNRDIIVEHIEDLSGCPMQEAAMRSKFHYRKRAQTLAY